MNITSTKIAGVLLIEPRDLHDDRGAFVKVFHKDTFVEKNMATNFVESYYSTSKKNVIRGMHFQTPPQDHAKLVYVTQGSIVDVILDIRKGSPTFGEFIRLNLNTENHHAVYIPVGCAHGFLSLEDATSVTYLQTTMHSPQHDAGILFDSFGFDWGVTEPIMSTRDRAFQKLSEFVTPFSIA